MVKVCSWKVFKHLLLLGCFSLNGKSVSVKVFLKSEVFMQYTSSSFSLMVNSFFFFFGKMSCLGNLCLNSNDLVSHMHTLTKSFKHSLTTWLLCYVFSSWFPMEEWNHVDIKQNNNLPTVSKPVALQTTLWYCYGERIFITEEQFQQGDFAG